MRRAVVSMALIGALLLGLTSSFCVIGAEMTIGDVNNDASVTTTDARIVLQNCAQKITLDAQQRLCADVNGDSEVNTTDARLILQYAAGILTEFPLQESKPSSVPKVFEMYEVDTMIEGQKLVVQNIVELESVSGWEASKATLVTSAEELRYSSIRLSDTLYQKYNATFFEEHALALIALPVGNANIHHEINALVRFENELCLDTTVTWIGGLDVTEQLTKRILLEVNKSDVSGIESVKFHSYDRYDESLKKSIPNINDDFEDDCVIITLKRAYSTVNSELRPEDFPMLDVIKVSNLRPYNDVRAEKVSQNGDFHEVLSLQFETKSKEHVVEAITILNEMCFIGHAQPSYYIYAD